MNWSAIDRSAIGCYCVGNVENHQRFSVGAVVGIIPKRIKNPMIIAAKPKSINPLLVPHRLFSNQEIFPNISDKYPEK
jgi:hypothetical protein